MTISEAQDQFEEKFTKETVSGKRVFIEGLNPFDVFMWLCRLVRKLKLE